jgi:hypothetical protein
MKSNGCEHGGNGRDSIALDALRQHIDAHPEVLRPIDAGLVGRIHFGAGCDGHRIEQLPFTIRTPQTRMNTGYGVESAREANRENGEERG